MTLVFVQKVLTVLPPLELFSLEEKAALLPGGLFVCVKSLSAQNVELRRYEKSSALNHSIIRERCIVLQLRCILRS